MGLTGFKSVLKPLKGGCLYRGSGPIPEEPVAGGIIFDKAFFSTSPNKKIAEGCLRVQSQDKPRYLFKISKYSTGINIQKLSSAKHEEETLFAPSTWFRVASVDPAHSLPGVYGTITLVELKEMM